MTTRRLFDVDPLTGEVEYFHFDHDTGKFSIETVQDVEPVLDENHRLANSGDGFNQARDLRRIASIPHVLYQAWLSVGFDALKPENAPMLRKLLNDADYRKLRTSPGKA